MKFWIDFGNCAQLRGLFRLRQGSERYASKEKTRYLVIGPILMDGVTRPRLSYNFLKETIKKVGNT